MVKNSTKCKTTKVKRLKVDKREKFHLDYFLVNFNYFYVVAAALGPLACPSLSARSRSCLNLTNPEIIHMLRFMVI